MRFSKHGGPLSWKPSARGDCFVDVGFNLVSSLRESVERLAPSLKHLFPFVNDQSWLINSLIGSDWVVFILRRNHLGGANIPFVGEVKGEEAVGFQSLAVLEDAQSEVRKMWTSEQFVYLGPCEEGALSWVDLQGCFFDWINASVVPHVERLNEEHERRFRQPIAAASVSSGSGARRVRRAEDFYYDVALSFAGEDRHQAKAIADLLIEKRIRVFYDDYAKADLWGKDLYTHLAEVYSEKARYCVMLLSQHYAVKLWTNHERKAAQARAFQENSEYILPIRLDDSQIPGILPTTGYIHIRDTPLGEIVELLLAKLRT